MGNGNGNNEDYAQVVVSACTGDRSSITYDEPAFRDARTKANQALAALAMIGLGGKPVSEYREGNLTELFKDFPDWAHIVRVEVNKLNHQSDRVKPFQVREYDCVHTKEPA